MLVFAYYSQHPDHSDAIGFRFSFLLYGSALGLWKGDAIRLTTLGGSLTCWLRWGARGVVDCQCASTYADSLFNRMDEEGDYERRLSVMVNCYCGFLEIGELKNDEIKVGIILCGFDFPFDRA